MNGADGRKPSASPLAIELIGIDKRFGEVHANKAVDLAVARGSIHGIVGENGAGKSTLMSILYGFYEADAGEIRVGGRPVRIRAPREAIACRHRHGAPALHAGGAAERARQRHARRRGRRAARPGGAQACAPNWSAWRATTGSPSIPTRSSATCRSACSSGVEILKALVRGADILVLDEPTAVLTPEEADQLFRLLRLLAGEGKTVILITHKLREIMAVTDRVSVMRRGEMVGDARYGGDVAGRARRADGRAPRAAARRERRRPGPAPCGSRSRTSSCATPRARRGVDGVSLSVRAGEIVGIAGIAGNGQSELLEALAGMRPLDGGRISLGGHVARRAGARSARACASAACCTCRRTGCAWASCRRSRPARAPSSASSEEERYGSGRCSDRDAVIERHGREDGGTTTCARARRC